MVNNLSHMSSVHSSNNPPCICLQNGCFFFVKHQQQQSQLTFFLSSNTCRLRTGETYFEWFAKKWFETSQFCEKVSELCVKNAVHLTETCSQTRWRDWVGGEGEGTFIVMSHPGEWLHWRAATSIDSDRWLKCTALHFVISTLSIPTKKTTRFHGEAQEKDQSLY